MNNGKEGVLPLVHELKANPSANVRTAIVSVLLNIGKPGVNGVIEALPQYPLEVRRHVVRELGDLGALESQMRNEILKGMQGIKDEEIRPEVEEVMKKIQEQEKEQEQEKGKQSAPAPPSRAATSSAPQRTNSETPPASRIYAPTPPKQGNKK